MDFTGPNSLAHLRLLAGEDALERDLARSIGEARLTDGLVRDLLDASVYVFAPEEIPEGPFRAAAGQGVPALSWEVGCGAYVLPFFTSLRAMSRSFQGTARYVRIAARTVFATTDERMRLIMNFGSPTAREFSAAEATELLRTHPQAPGRARSR